MYITCFIEVSNIGLYFINTLHAQAAVVTCCKAVLIDNRLRYMS